MRKAGVWILLLVALPMSAYAGQCPLTHAKPRLLEKKPDSLWTAEMWTKNGQRVIKFYGVDVGDGRNITAYGGPIEIQDRTGRSLCKADIDTIEFLKPPLFFAQDRYVYFLSGDAIDVGLDVVDLNTCTYAWRSRTYNMQDNEPRPRITEKALYLGGKKVPIKDDCLPDAPSAEITQ